MDDPSDIPPLPSRDWDVVISGSGIKQSLLAAALARAGKTVLQLDKNNYYGGSSTAFYSLPEAEAWAASVNNGGEAGVTNAVSSRSRGEAGRGYTLSLTPHLVYWYSDVLGMLRRADMTDAFSWQAVGSWWVWLTEEDVRVPAAGKSGGSGLAEVGVKAARIAATAVRKKQRGWNKGRKGETIAEGSRSGAQPILLEGARAADTALRKRGDFREVPCTFEDVAWDSDLTDKDRGQLGEFLRLVMKHNDPTSGRYSQTFQENRKTSLKSFLSTTFPIPPSVLTSVSSLTLLLSPPSEVTLDQALPRLTTHLSSLGKIPDVCSSAALTIAYGGSAELCQVLSRAAAVAGGINILGRGIKQLSTNRGEGEGRRLEVQLETGEVAYADWVIGESSDLAGEVGAEVTEGSVARGIYIIEGEISWLFERKYATENITPASAVVAVPGAEGVPTYLVARSAATGECPKGQCLLHAITLSSYEVMNSAVEKLLNSLSPPPKIFYSLQYTAATTRADKAGQEEGIAVLDSLSHDIALGDGTLEEALGIYEAVMGSRDRFMELPEHMRRLKEEMIEE